MKQIILIFAILLLIGCKKDNWKEPITENLPDSIFVIDNGDTILWKDFEQEMDSFVYYMEKYKND